MTPPPLTPIRVLLVDDHELVLESWKLLLDNDKRFTVIAQCSNGEDAVEQAKLLTPDVILMDINMEPINGFEATQRIASATPTIKIIGVSANNNPRYATKLLKLGGKGFVTKTSAFEELKTAIQKVHLGEDYICHELRDKLSEM
ncbi:MAG: response regulator transcription factor [Chitinophagaceae bacterium]|nr:response regulator transcription factor [Chitinophagaceae bacterium]